MTARTAIWLDRARRATVRVVLGIAAAAAVGIAIGPAPAQAACTPGAACTGPCGCPSKVTVNAQTTVSKLNVFGLTTPRTAGVAGSLTVRAVDSFGNVVQGYTGTVKLSSTTDPAAVFSPLSHAFVAADKGQFTFTVT